MRLLSLIPFQENLFSKMQKKYRISFNELSLTNSFQQKDKINDLNISNFTNGNIIINTNVIKHIIVTLDYMFDICQFPWMDHFLQQWSSKFFVRIQKNLVLKVNGRRKCISFLQSTDPVCIFMFKVNYRNTRARCEICSELTIKTPERRQWSHSGVFIVNFEHISHILLVFLLLTLSR